MVWDTLVLESWKCWDDLIDGCQNDNQPRRPSDKRPCYRELIIEWLVDWRVMQHGSTTSTDGMPKRLARVGPAGVSYELLSLS